MAVGFRAFLQFERPDLALIKAFEGIPSSNIGDCVKKMNCMFGGIRAFNHHQLLGTAFTVKVPSGDNLVAQAALDYTQPGDILVVDGAGYTDRALVGGMMLAYAQLRKLGGFVVNGAIRDLDDIRAGTIPVFAKAVTPQGPYREGPGEMNVPVVCGGQVVMPGDILVGDEDGIVVIPRLDAPELLEAAKKNLEEEQRTVARMGQGLYTKNEHKDAFTSRFTRQGGTFCNRNWSGTTVP